jgi:YidC/Oxa1 family membrane protein insertase
MWSAIVNVMTKMFDALHSLIVSLGVSENAEGVSYVLAIVLFTAIIRLLILPLNIKATKSNAKMQEIQPEMQKLQKKYANDPQKCRCLINR